MVLVGLQRPHKLPRPPLVKMLIRGTVSNQRLALVELAIGRAAAGDTVVELPGPGELTVRASQKRGLKAAGPSRGRSCEPCAEIRGLAPASAARRIASRCCIHDMISRGSEKKVRTPEHMPYTQPSHLIASSFGEPDPKKPLLSYWPVHETARLPPLLPPARRMFGTCGRL